MRLIPVQLVIGIDPGTVCGWAVLRADGSRHESGTWNLKPGRHESAGMRWVRLRRSLSVLVSAYDRGPQLLAYEAVAAHRGTHAAHIYGGCVAVIQEVCEAAGMDYVGVPVGTVKKRATGKGNAGKAAVITAAADRWKLDPCTLDHNEADALWVAATALAMEVDDT